jgi:HAL2 family 3'(2'),5'-bisphosphate nucleotidase
MNMDHAKALEVAVEAVRAASIVCRKVQGNLVTAETVQKKDKSPVTVADFASQAVVCRALHGAFPSVPVVGEEDSKDLRADGADRLRASVTEHVAMVVAGHPSDDDVLAWIDHGGWTPDGSKGAYWTLDPIDGTKGFLRGEQYAIALALIENGKVTLGVLGCPNLPLVDGADENGILLTAVRGQGARLLRLTDHGAGGTGVHVSSVGEAKDARFCESVESGHSDQDASVQIACTLGITQAPYRIDSQCKYAAVARGDASIYLRLPTSAEYREKIWDHAAGAIVVEEAGGVVTDVHGKPLDFSRGRKLQENQGIIATNGRFHDQVVAAVQPALKHA